jgi:hypothetical protein
VNRLDPEHNASHAAFTAFAAQMAVAMANSMLPTIAL